MNAEIDLRERSIVFIGFMGVGKTTIGKLVAKKLYRDFIDIDVELEKEFKMPIPQVFQQLGEKAFREKEKEFRERMTRLGAPETKTSESSSNANRIIQIRVVETDKP